MTKIMTKILSDTDITNLEQNALTYLNMGNVAAAKEIYQQILETNPKHIQSLNMLSVICFQSGEHNEAISLTRKAIEYEPNQFSLHNNLGNMFQAIGNTQEAIKAFQRAIELNPSSPQSYYNLGLTLKEMGKIEEAIEATNKAIENDPNYIPSYNNLALLLQAAEQTDAAESAFKKALQIDPNHLEILNNYALLLQKERQFDKALELLYRALEINTNFAPAMINMGNIQKEQGCLDEALRIYQKAIELNPNIPQAHDNLHQVLKEQGKYDELITTYLDLLAKDSENPKYHFDLGLIYLTLEQFDKGWEHYEYRLKTNRAIGNEKQYILSYEKPLWQGEDLEGKTIYIYSEQGHGDIIQFSRYLQLLCEKGARIVFQSLPALDSIFNINNPKIIILPSNKRILAASYDYYCPLLSLPHRFKTDLNNVPPPSTLIKIDNKKSAYYKEKYFSENNTKKAKNTKNNKLKIGIAWQGDPNHPTDLNRSMPLSCFLPLFKLDNIQIYSLQKGEKGEKQIAKLPENCSLIELGSTFEDFSDTIAAIDNLDIIITVDTVIAHIAATLHKPTWVLIATAPEWRWFLKKNDSIWYNTIRLFRQKQMGEWQPLIKDIFNELQHYKCSNT